MLDEPRLVATIETGYTQLYSVSFLSEKGVWTCGLTEFIKLFNLQGKLLTSIQTKSGKRPEDFTVTREGDLVYIDCYSETVNLMKNDQIQTVITLQGWTPLNVCSTISDDLLVTMFSTDKKQSKVVRYSDFVEKQSIQFDDQGHLLYSPDYNTKYIRENKNLDICVADSEAGAVVVVNQTGELRFRYTGHLSNMKECFYPVGITTDSQSRLLTADYNNGCIHILDEDGQCLRYINNCHLDCPFGLCLDTNDNLFVAEYDTVKVKKIQYLTQC
jgi:hypothetical protein